MYEIQSVYLKRVFDGWALLPVLCRNWLACSEAAGGRAASAWPWRAGSRGTRQTFFAL